MRTCTFSTSAGNSSPYLSPSPGEASLGLLRMVRPEFAVELRTAIHHAKKQEIAVRKEGIRVQRDGHPWDVCLEVVPIKSDLGERFFLVLFQETPAREPAGPEAAGRGAGHRQAAVAGGRPAAPWNCRRPKESLQSMIQEQEAINEELKSANEEALSSNEELQSTNEELETAKEELQSTNEELVTVNEQLREPQLRVGATQRRSHQPAQQRQHSHPDAERRLAHPAFHAAGRKTAELAARRRGAPHRPRAAEHR